MELLHELNSELGTCWMSEDYAGNIEITAKEFERIFCEYDIGEKDLPESVKLIVFICQSTIRLAKSRKCTLIMLNKPVLM